MLNDLPNALISIPTVEESVQEFLDEVKPEALIFGVIGNGISRIKYYENFGKKIEAVTEYTFRKCMVLDKNFYLLEKDCDGEELKGTIKRIGDSTQKYEILRK